MKRLIFLLLLSVLLSVTKTQAEKADGKNYSFFLNIVVIYEDKTAVDSALMEVYDQDHRYLGQYYSNDQMMGYNLVEDTTAINYYGIYYIKVSKPGYQTVECKMELKNDAIQYSPEIVMKPVRTYWWWVIVAGLIAGLSACWYYGYRKRKRVSLHE